MLRTLRIVPSWFNVSDEQHVERLRRSVKNLDRWRRPLTALYVLSAAAYIGSLVAAVLFLDGLGKNLGMQGWGPGFLFGLLLGATLGTTGLKIFHGLFIVLMGLHNERLLIQYFDAYRAMCDADEMT